MTRKLTHDQVRSIAMREAAAILRRYVDAGRQHLFESAPTTADRDALVEALHQLANEHDARAQAIAKLEAGVRLMQQGTPPTEAARIARVNARALSWYVSRQRAAGVQIPRFTSGPNPKPKLEDLIEVAIDPEDR